MIEALLVVLVLVVLFALGAAALLPWATSLAFCTVLFAVGFGVGLPTAIVWHVRLWQALRRHGPVPRHWIWDPISYHRWLDASDRTRVYPWFYVAGAAFGLVALGILWTIVAMVAALSGV